MSNADFAPPRVIRWALVAAGVSGLLAVAIGAFGAHALRGGLDAAAFGVFRTAERYQFLHTLALFGAALAPSAGLSRRPLTSACLAWLIGIVLFSGSLYALAITGITALGAITPFGGMAFMVGWALLAIAAWQRG